MPKKVNCIKIAYLLERKSYLIAFFLKLKLCLYKNKLFKQNLY